MANTNSASLTASTSVLCGSVVTIFYRIEGRERFEVQFVASSGGTYDTREFYVASPHTRDFYPSVDEAKNAAMAYHTEEVMRRSGEGC